MSLLRLLRDDLQLFQGPPAKDGSAVWSIFDPVRNQYFQIPQFTFEVLQHWHLGDPEEIVEACLRQGNQPLTLERIEEINEFLKLNQLLRVDSLEDIQMLSSQSRSGEKNWLGRVLKGYLFFRIPLIRPDLLLNSLLPVARTFFNKFWLLFIMVLGGSGLLLSLRQWDVFMATAVELFSIEGLLFFFIALFFTKVCHEMGHAIAAKHYGCRVPTMGVAFLVMFPVLYTDTTDSWRLSSYNQRMMIGISGILAELVLACIATFLWSFLPEGSLRSVVFILATVTWVGTLLINLNPLMRFDGYYLLSDWWQIENLQFRAFSLARWQLREWLFRLDQPAPEVWDRTTRKKLLIYAYSTWIYRFFLFLGIALLVYFLFFKVLGLILFVVEIAWFIVLPIWQEMRHWWKMREGISLNRRIVLPVMLILIIGGGLFFPFDQTLRLPAVQFAEKTTLIHAPFKGTRIREVAVSLGDAVTEGQILLILDSPDLDHQLKAVAEKIDLAKALLKRKASNIEYLQDSPVLLRRLTSLKEEQQGLINQQNKLNLKAPFPGVVTSIDPMIHPGAWLQPRDDLLKLVDQSSTYVEAYVDETELNRLSINNSGRFYSDDLTIASSQWQIEEIDRVGSSVLESPYLSAEFGGPIAVNRNLQGEAVPPKGLYRLILKPENFELTSFPRVLTGSMSVEASGEALVIPIWKNLWSVIIRESGV